MLYIDGEPADLQLTASVELEVTHTGARRPRRHGLRRRQQAGHPGDGRDRERPAVREHRGSDQGRHALGLVHVACVGPSSGARRSSPSISTTSRSRPLDDLFERDAPAFTRALAHATADYADELDVHIERHAKNWTVDRIAPLETRDPAHRAARDAPSRARRGRHADPARGRHRRGRGDRESVLRCRCPRLRERHSGCSSAV